MSPSIAGTAPRTVATAELVKALVEIATVQISLIYALSPDGSQFADMGALGMRSQKALSGLLRAVGQGSSASPPTAEQSLAARARDILTIPSSEAQLDALVGATPALWEAVIREIKTPSHDEAQTREVPTYLTPCAFADVIEVIITSGESDEADGYRVVEAVTPGFEGTSFQVVRSHLRPYRTRRVAARAYAP